MNILATSAIGRFAAPSGPVYPLTVTIDGDKPQVYKNDKLALDVPKGKSFTMAIPEKAVAGYKWMVDCDDERLQVLKNDFQLPEGSDGNVDQIGTRTFTLQLDTAEPVNMQLSLRRSWDPASKPVSQKVIALN